MESDRPRRQGGSMPYGCSAGTTVPRSLSPLAHQRYEHMEGKGWSDLCASRTSDTEITRQEGQMRLTGQRKALA